MPFVVLVVLVTVVITVAAAAQSRADRWNRSYQALARRYGGTCIPAGWFGRPSVRFRYGATHALLNTYRLGSAQFTQMVINWPDPNLRCEISKDQSILTQDDEALSADWNAFHRHYTIVGSDHDLIRALLSDGVRWQIERLRRLQDTDEVYVSIYRGRMLIRKRVLFQRYDDLEEFAQLALELYDQAMLTRTTGIEFVQPDQAQVIQEAVCRVCGDEIVTDMVFCRRCKTPHHLECWQYYGACCVYGCQETRWIAPRAADPPNSR